MQPSRSSLAVLLAVCAFSAKRRSEEHTSEFQSRLHLVCRLLLEKKTRTSKESISEESHDYAYHVSLNHILLTPKELRSRRTVGDDMPPVSERAMPAGFRHLHAD